MKTNKNKPTSDVIEWLKVSEIVFEYNPRKDANNLGELTSSIRSKGIIVPLIVRKKEDKYELVAGQRRFRCAQALNFDLVPAIVLSGSDNEALDIQLIENIQRENLTAIEEAEAFQRYLDIQKCKISDISKRTGKTEKYIKRRLLLLKLRPEVKEALENHKIEIGHATLLSQMNEKQQLVSLDEIQDYDLTVQNFADQIRWMQHIDFESTKFRPEIGEHQTILDQVCTEMAPKSDVGGFKDNQVFKAELAKYLEGQRKILVEKGINVFPDEQKLKKKYPKAKSISSYETDYKKALTNITDKSRYAVVVYLSQWGEVCKHVFDINPEVKKQAKVSKPAKELTPKEKKAAADALATSRKERLKNRMTMFRHQEHRRVSEDLIGKNPGKLDNFVLSIIVHVSFAYQSPGDNELRKAAFARMGLKAPQFGQIPWSSVLRKCLNLSPETVRESLELMTKAFIHGMDTSTAEVAAKALGLSWKEHFALTEEFLDLLTKEQLEELVISWKLPIDLTAIGKVGNLKKQILSTWKPGLVPVFL